MCMIDLFELKGSSIIITNLFIAILEALFKDLIITCEDLKVAHEFGPAHWRLLEEMRDLLVTFAKAVTDIEGENYCTISSVYPMVNGMILKLKKVLFIFCLFLLFSNSIFYSLKRIVRQRFAVLHKDWN